MSDFEKNVVKREAERTLERTRFYNAVIVKLLEESTEEDAFRALFSVKLTSLNRETCAVYA